MTNEGMSVKEALTKIAEASEGLTKATEALAQTAEGLVKVAETKPQSAAIPVVKAVPADPMALWVAAHIAAKGKDMGVAGTEAYQQAISLAKAHLGEAVVQKALTSSEVPFLPVDIVAEVEAAFNAMVVGRRIFRTIRSATKTGKYPLAGAATAYVATEGQAPASESEPTLGSANWEICYVVAPLTITYEAANDFAILQSSITNILLQALGEKEDELFLTGSGTGQPLGIYTALNAAADLLDGTNKGLGALITIWNQLKEPYKADAVWFMNAATLTKLQRQETSSAGFYMGTLTDGFRSMLFGRPIYVSPALADNVVLVGSANKYIIIDKVNAATGARELYIDATREGKTLLSTRSIYLMLADGIGGIPLYSSSLNLKTWRGITNFLTP